MIFTNCPMCNNENQGGMGIMGPLLHIRCRACGWDYSHTLTEDEKAMIAEEEEDDDTE